MNKDDCIVGQNVAYFPTKSLDEVEYGIVTELRDNWAMVLYENNGISKATYYSALEIVPETLALVRRGNENC